MTPENPPKDFHFDIFVELLKNIEKDTHVVFNCQIGF